MTEYEPIIGKIAKIQDKYRVIINKGAEDGVTKNMKFYAYEEGEEIIDPDTNNIIEREEILKAHLNVIHVQEKISTPIRKIREIPRQRQNMATMYKG